jgi:translation elongation factor EF-Tu-like GTPase
MVKAKLERTKPRDAVGATGHADRGGASPAGASQFHSRTTEVTGSISLPPGAAMVMAGDSIQ